MTESEQFFYDNAGYSYGPGETAEQGHVESARALATAERLFLDGPYSVSFEPDPEPWDGDEPYDGPLWVVTLWTVEGQAIPQVLAVMGGVACPEGDAFLRVVTAELASEHIEDTSEDLCTEHGHYICPDCANGGVKMTEHGYAPCTRFLRCWSDA